ncbi:hypothetical protein K3G39_02860 [Pontibacter sp. HSC-14F20]|uniref:hypothetical protein n=1 Tax=Pontibacter sp. HSC-14F20 TaxID=2864136 RepID=UPI001C72A603|nr:hypothetical protein [Pontibacter sp. HSC-14F20]MBX0332169.1 hypothetical protein [Pontibacter sp. HSC-14F20]
MNANALNSSLVAIISKKEELNALDYNDERYDDMEEELHDMEDDFNEEFGDYLEDALEEVHGKLRSDADILLPTAYLANTLEGGILNANGEKEGVWVESDEFPGTEMRLVLTANPARFVVLIGDQERELWKAE